MYVCTYIYIYVFIHLYLFIFIYYIHVYVCTHISLHAPCIATHPCAVCQLQNPARACGAGAERPAFLKQLWGILVSVPLGFSGVPTKRGNDNEPRHPT